MSQKFGTEGGFSNLKCPIVWNKKPLLLVTTQLQRYRIFFRKDTDSFNGTVKERSKNSIDLSKARSKNTNDILSVCLLAVGLRFPCPMVC